MLELKRLIKALSVSEQGVSKHAVSKHAVSKHAVSEPGPLDPQFLCTIVSIVSLNVLARNNSIKNLSANATSDLSSLNHDEIFALAKTLHERAQALAPHSVRNVMPLPMPLTASQWSALKQFFKATKDLPLFANEIAIGHAYQLCSQLRRKEALKQVQSSNKEMNVDALISFTQLYTPQWVVDTLIAQTLPACKPSIARLPTEVNIIDPACGAGNFLLPAFEAVLKICCAEGISESDAVEHMSRGGLSGVDIDPYGIWITSLALTTRCLRLKAPMAISFKGIQLLEINDSEESILGTLDRNFDLVDEHPLSKRYSVVLTNPPYIGRKLLSRELKQLLREHYPNDSHDISVAFTRRCLELLEKGGRLGLITQSSILYLPSSKQFRQSLIEDFNPILAVEAGTGVFPLQSGEKIDSVLMVIERPKSTAKTNETEMEPTLFVNLRKEKEKGSALEHVLQEPASNPLAYRRSVRSFSRFPNSQFNYACPDAAVTLFEKLPPLSDYAEVRQGLATTDNDRFVRFMWDVKEEEINSIWFPYVKGAGSQRWFSPVVNVVKWENDGFEIKEAVKKAYPYLKGKVHWVVKNEKYYFQEGLSFSFVNNGDLAVRLLPAGCIFDVAASALFPVSIDRYALLAFLNSSFASKMAHLINPTINFQVGDVKRLPMLPFTAEEMQELAHLAAVCVEATEEISRQRDFHLIRFLHHPNSCQKDRTASRCSLKEAYSKHSSTVEKNALLLETTESEIDSLVLTSLKRKAILTEEEFVQIETWIKREVKNKTAEKLAAKTFAERYVGSLVVEKLGKVEQTETPVDFSAESLGLSEEDTSWLETHLETSLKDWINKSFIEFKRQQFASNLWTNNSRELSRSRS